MQIVIEIPEDKIPTKQCYKDVLIKFVDKQVCEVTLIGQIPREDETRLWFDVLPEGHGDLVDRDLLRKRISEDKREAFTKHEVWLLASEYNTDVHTVVPADKDIG